MKKFLLAGLLSLTLLLNGCALSIPWWLFLKNDPSRAGYPPDQLITKQKPAPEPQPLEKKPQSEVAQSLELQEPSAH